MKKVLFTFTLILTSFIALSQAAKKGCNPSACKPGNTKVEEALVITDLRESLVSLKQELKAQHILEVSSVTIGMSEEESLDIIVEEVNMLEGLLGKSHTNFKKWEGAKLVARLESTINEMKD